MGKLFLAIKFAAALIVILLMIGFGIGSSKGMPDYAQVYVNDAAKTYLAPPCMKATASFRIVTAGKAITMGYKPDGKCRDEGAFMQNDRSLTGTFLQTIGFLKPMPSRWDKDGSWKY
jgi:hypothetical protein